MALDEIEYKWLNIAYSEKKNSIPNKKQSYAGNKGIGRFSCDRLGETLILYTKVKGGVLLRLEIDWTMFEVDDKETEIGHISIKHESISIQRLRKETDLKSFSNGTVLFIKNLRTKWTKDKLHSLRKQLEKFVADPKKQFTVYLKVDRFQDEPSLNGKIQNKIFDQLAFRTTYISSDITKDGNSILTKLFHDGQELFALTEKNPYKNLKNITATIYFLNQPAKAFFKIKTGYRSVEYGSIFLFLNGFRVLPYGAESDDWLGIDRRHAQGTRRFFGTRELVGFIHINDDSGTFKAVSSREGLVNNSAFKELTSPSNTVPSSLDQKPIYGFVNRIIRKLEKFVVEGLNWDRIISETKQLDDEQLLDEKNFQYLTEKQKIVDSLNSIISLHSPQKYIEDLEVKFKNIISLAKDENEAFLDLVDSLQEKFKDTSVANITPAEKRDLSKFIKKQAKALAAKDSTAKQLENRLETETKRRLFAEYEKSTDVEKILEMHHQTRLLSGKIFKSLDNILMKYRQSPTSISIEKLVNVIEKSLFDIDKIRKVSGFASKASFNLKTNRVKDDLLLFIEEYIAKIEEVSDSWNLKIVFENPSNFELIRSFRPLELIILIDNLIDNAGKAKAKKLIVSIKRSESKTTIQFKDNGIGLPNEIKNSLLFEKGVTTTDGSGIGLFHVRQIVEELSGVAKIRNNADRGTSVFLEFKN